MTDRQEVGGSDIADQLGNASHVPAERQTDRSDGSQIKWLVKSLFSQQLKSVAISEGLNLPPPPLCLSRTVWIIVPLLPQGGGDGGFIQPELQMAEEIRVCTA